MCKTNEWTKCEVNTKILYVVEVVVVATVVVFGTFRLAACAAFISNKYCTVFDLLADTLLPYSM